MASSPDDSWGSALAAAKKIGYIPTAFSQAQRMLVNDELKNNGSLRPVTKYQIARVFRGPSFKSMLYFATKALREDFVAKNPVISVGDMIALYTPLDLAAMISCFFLNRRARKTNPEIWAQISPHFIKEAQIGAQVGVAIPSVGVAPGLLIAALRNVSHLLMTKEDVGVYKKHRSNLQTTGRPSSDKLELEAWGTTSAQVSTMLLTNLGYRSEVGEALSAAVGTQKKLSEIKEPLVRRFRLGQLWADTFMTGAQQPEDKLDGQYFPFENDRQRAVAQVGLILGGSRGWLEREKKDLNETEAPHMFRKPATPAEHDIPEQLRDVFSIAELTSMDENDFDALIDQIDAEAANLSKKREDVIATADLQELEKNIE